jgi:hypothetical protein
MGAGEGKESWDAESIMQMNLSVWLGNVCSKTLA